MGKGQIVRRTVGTLLLIATIGFTSFQGLYHAAIGVFAHAPAAGAARHA